MRPVRRLDTDSHHYRLRPLGQHLLRQRVQRQLPDVVARLGQHIGQKLLFCFNIGRRASIQITADRYGHLSADDLVDMVDGLAAA